MFDALNGNAENSLENQYDSAKIRMVVISENVISNDPHCFRVSDIPSAQL